MIKDPSRPNSSPRLLVPAVLLAFGVIGLVVACNTGYQQRIPQPSSAQRLVSATPRPAYSGQHIGFPAYFSISASIASYSQLANASPVVQLAIVNHASGPGTDYSPILAASLQRARSAGIRILGYVLTDWTKRPLAEVEKDIQFWIGWYNVDGIFLDQATHECKYLSYYSRLRTFIRSYHPQAIVALNPASAVGECYMTVADTVVTFEGTYTSYLSDYTAPAWVRNYAASRFWHIIFSAVSAADLQRVIALSQARRAGYLFVTSIGLPHPYSYLPPGDYWTSEVTLVYVSRTKQ